MSFINLFCNCIFFQHEDATIKMFDYILENNRKVTQAFEAKRLTDVDKTFIKELIGKKGQVRKYNLHTSNFFDHYFSDRMHYLTTHRVHSFLPLTFIWS